MRAAVVGGGLAGLAAALDLVDAGVDVTLYEARPTLGGAVQTLPEREGDPDPPPDNGQHIALGCFTEYLRFLDRVGEAGSYVRKRLALPVLAEDRAVAEIRSSLPALLAYRHLPFRERLRLPLTTARMRSAEARDGETFGGLLRRLGASDAAIDRFWDVFIRPALNLNADEADASAGLFTVRTALLGHRRNADLILPTRPLGTMHGDAAGHALRIAGQLTDRLGAAELLWSRVSREPHATIALRPGVVRAGTETGRPGVVRAGAWTDTGWPATMESAVRSGRAAARRVVVAATEKVDA